MCQLGGMGGQAQGLGGWGEQRGGAKVKAKGRIVMILITVLINDRRQS